MCQLNTQSCDCDCVIVKMKGQDTYIFLECEKGALTIKTAPYFDANVFCLKHTPPQDKSVLFVNAELDKNGVIAIKFSYGDRYLFFFANENEELIITVSRNDFFNEDNVPIPDYDDSELTIIKTTEF